MTDKVITTVFMTISITLGVLIALWPAIVLRIVGRSTKRHSSKSLTAWRILGGIVSVGCATRLIGIWFFGWST